MSGAIRGRASGALVLLAYVALTALFTYPMVTALGDAVRDPGDPLLNAWIMAWDVQSASRGDLAGIFDADLFYPYEKTLAYSEVLFPQAAVGAPFYWLTGNPTFAYNLALLVSFALTAFCAYLLAKDLTGNRAAAFAAGMIFAFNPFMFDHLSQIQVIGAAGIPLAFLFLVRFFASGRTLDLLAFTSVYVLQVLANLYYGLFLTAFAGLYILYRLLHDGRLRDARLWAQLALHGAISLGVLGPIIVQFLTVKEELGFRRTMGFGATPGSFFAAPPINRLYGSITEPLQAPEAQLFAGFVALLLAAVGLAAAWRREATATDPGSEASNRRSAVVPAYRVLGVLLYGGCAVLALIVVTGGFQIPLGETTLSFTRIKNTSIAVIILATVRWALRDRYAAALGPLRRFAPRRREFAAMVAVAVLLSFGPTGPYVLLHRYVPGFDGIRAIPRVHVITMLGLSVLAAYGFRFLSERLSGRGKQVFAAAAFALISLEYLSVPLPATRVPADDEIPPVHRWLADQPGDFAIVHYPFVLEAEYWRAYYNAYHGKALVNGYSGFVPPLYLELWDRSAEFPSAGLLVDLESLGLRYVIVDTELYAEDGRERVEAAISRFPGRLRLVESFGPTRVYELLQRLPAAPAAPRLIVVSEERKLDRSRWKVTAEPFGDDARLAIDGDPDTVWTTGPQRPGMFFEVDLGEVRLVDRIVIDPGDAGQARNYPRGYRLEVSVDGSRWRELDGNDDYAPPAVDFLWPREIRFELALPPTRVRYLRIVQTASDQNFHWSIAELEIEQAATAGPAANPGQGGGSGVR